jgi:hypothetical protein
MLANYCSLFAYHLQGEAKHIAAAYISRGQIAVSGSAQLRRTYLPRTQVNRGEELYNK